MQKQKTNIDWHYQRKNCQTCQKAQDYIDSAKVAVSEVVDARKVRIDPQAAVALARSMDRIHATKGSKLVYFDLKADKPADEDLVSLLIGPSGNLRAPSIKVGKTLVVGFSPEVYKEVLGDN